MREGVPRLLLAFTAMVAIGIICLVIKDYVQEKKAPPPADNSPTVESKAKTPPKKNSAEIKRSRIFSTNATTAEDAGDEMEKPLVRDELGNVGRKAILANGEIASSQAEDEEEAVDQAQANEIGKNKKMTSSRSSAAHCLPLPNKTNLADVDAPYYTNWAREYWCYESIPPAKAKPKLK
jgi:hypothetical protein